MKGQLLTLIGIIFSLSVVAQTKKATPKQSEKTIIAAKAKRWFREFYVAEYFKDPYSYKLLKFEISPVSHYEIASRQIEEAQMNVKEAEVDLKKIDTLSANSKYREHKDTFDITKADYDGRVKKYGEHSSEVKSLVSKYNSQYMAVYSDTVGLEQANAKKNKWLEILKNNINIKSKAVSYYYVEIECHASNSYGGRVFNRYSFKFNKNGIIGDVIDQNE